MNSKITTLKNGLTVITTTDKNTKFITAGIGVGAGGRDEREDQTGIAHLLEHMAFKGTTTRSCKDIAYEIESLGGDINAYTGKEETVYHVKMLATHLDKAVELLSDIVLNSVFPAEELEKERHVVIQEIKMYEDEPDSVLHDEFYANCFPNHPYGRSILGSEEQILNYSREDLLNFVTEHYVPSNMILSVGGNVKHSDVVKLAKKYLNKNSVKYVSKRTPATFTAGETKVIKPEMNQCHYLVAYQSITNKNLKDLVAANLFRTILGDGMISRLFMEVREKRGLVYSIYAYNHSIPDTGIFEVFAGTDPKHINETMEVIDTELNKFIDTVTWEELEIAKSKRLSTLSKSSENVHWITMQNISEYFDKRKLGSFEEVETAIKSTSLEDIKNIAKKILSSERHLAYLGNADIELVK